MIASKAVGLLPFGNLNWDRAKSVHLDPFKGSRLLNAQATVYADGVGDHFEVHDLPFPPLVNGTQQMFNALDGQVLNALICFDPRRVGRGVKFVQELPCVAAISGDL